MMLISRWYLLTTISGRILCPCFLQVGYQESYVFNFSSFSVCCFNLLRSYIYIWSLKKGISKNTEFFFSCFSLMRPRLIFCHSCSSPLSSPFLSFFFIIIIKLNYTFNSIVITRTSFVAVVNSPKFSPCKAA